LIDLDDYRWLTGPEAAGWLHRAAAQECPLLQLIGRLRRELSAARAHLVLEQAELRRRAEDKFEQAGRMFFTRKGLQQATDQWIAAYKAARFPPQGLLADLCCGIGGDLLALAARGSRTLGIDRDPAVAMLAAANVDVLGLSGRAEVRVGDATAFSPAGLAGLHIDPDRRPAGRRTTQAALAEPSLPAIECLLAAEPDAAVKLAPAARAPEDWQRRAELEWISRGGECRQQVAWFGRPAECPGQHRATVLGGKPLGECSATLVAAELVPPAPAGPLRRFVFDPDPAVLAAGLVGVLAARHGLGAISARAAYLTGERPIRDPLLDCFEVLEVLPLDVKRLRRMLAERRVGAVEIKKRGVACDVEQLRRRLDLHGDQPAVLLLAPAQGSVRAIVARRTDS